MNFDVRILVLPDAIPEIPELELIGFFPHIEEIRSGRALSVTKSALLQRRLASQPSHWLPNQLGMLASNDPSTNSSNGIRDS